MISTVSLQRVCHIFVPDQRLYYFPSCPMAKNFIFHVENLFPKISRKFPLHFGLGQLIMPRVINSDVLVAFWAHHQNGLSGRNISDKLFFNGICASKRRVNKIFGEITLERQGAMKPVKRLGSLRVLPTPFWKWKISSSVPIPGRYEWFPRSWTYPSQSSSGFSSRFWWEKCAIQAQNSSVRQDGGSTAGKGVPACSSTSSTTDEEISWIFDEAWRCLSHVNGWWQIFCEFHGKKGPERKRKICAQKHPREVRFVAGISAFGPTASLFFPPDAKVHAKLYFNKLLKPLFEKDISRLFGKDVKSAVLHHDSARAHTVATTVQWLEISATILFLRGIGPLALPICHPWIIRWMEVSSSDFGSGRDAAWRDYNGVMRQEWSSVCWSVLKRFLPGNPAWKLCFRVMAFRLNTRKSFFFLFCRVKEKTE